MAQLLSNAEMEEYNSGCFFYETEEAINCIDIDSYNSWKKLFIRHMQHPEYFSEYSDIRVQNFFKNHYTRHHWIIMSAIRKILPEDKRFDRMTEIHILTTSGRITKQKYDQYYTEVVDMLSIEQFRAFEAL